ncbi:UNVERIFIED_CONTAM: ATP synthase subunit b', chloroplastic [Sesamum calycinum]|uniref:ATP synthase subunit b', chloroplastic n=1 Tax=Sesamum calycinum TaxID=2727403 RepID=A0AAW2IVB2_9LAMI
MASTDPPAQEEDKFFKGSAMTRRGAYAAIFYMACAVLLVMFNKAALSSYNFPCANVITLCQMISSCSFLYVLRRSKLISFSTNESLALNDSSKMLVSVKTLINTSPLSLTYLLYMVVLLLSCILAFFLNYSIFLNTTLNSALTDNMWKPEVARLMSCLELFPLPPHFVVEDFFTVALGWIIFGLPFDLLNVGGQLVGFIGSAMMQILEHGDDHYDPRFSTESLSCILPPIAHIDSPKRSLSYHELFQHPLWLSILKLDGSSFGNYPYEIYAWGWGGVVEWYTLRCKYGDSSELKEAVEAAFDHLPKKGPGSVSCCSLFIMLLIPTIWKGTIREREDPDSDHEPCIPEGEKTLTIWFYSGLILELFLFDSNNLFHSPTPKSNPIPTHSPTFPPQDSAAQIRKTPPTTGPPRRRHHLLTCPRPAFSRCGNRKGSPFRFQSHLPIIALEFLFLMFALDKVYYTPLGKFMDERDAAIREKLNSVKDTSAEVKQLEDQAAAVMKAARAEISAALNKMKKETQIEVEQKLAEGRKKVEAELQEALSSLEKQKEETVKALDSQIAALSEEIVKKVLPVS